MKRAPTYLSIAGLALVLGGCRAVLGIDEPTLDPCAEGCVDGSLESGLVDSGGAVDTADGAPITDSAVESAPPSDVVTLVEAASEAAAPTGVQCGPSAQATYCTDALPVCCRKNADASVIYSCVSGVAACSANGDYDIQCSSASNCGTGQVCCHYGSAMKCESVKDCLSGGDTVCDPNGISPCAAGSTCSRQLPSLPYFACAP